MEEIWAAGEVVYLREFDEGGDVRDLLERRQTPQSFTTFGSNNYIKMCQVTS